MLRALISTSSENTPGNSLAKNLSVIAVAFMCVACSNVQTTGVDRSGDVEEPAIQSEAGIHGRGADTSSVVHALPRKEWAAYQRVLPEERWFEVYRVLPNIFAIYEPINLKKLFRF